MNAKVQYTPVKTLRGDMKLPVKKNTHAFNDGQFVLQTMMLFVFLQIAQDVIDELINAPHVKGKFKWERAKIYDGFNTLRKRRKRTLEDDEINGFDDAVCMIADNCDDNLQLIKNTAITEFSQKMPYDQVKSAVLLGTAHGCLSAAQRLNVRLMGKNNSVITTIQDNLSEICDQVGYRALNKNSWITPDYCADAWNKMIKKVASECTDFFNNK